MPIRGFLILAFFLGSLPVCFIRPFYGILLWSVIAFLNPQASLFYWSVADSFPWALAVAIPTLCGFVIFSKGWMGRLASREVAMIVVLWTWFTITSYVSSQTPLFIHHTQDTWTRWGFVSKILLMTLVIIAIVDSLARLRILVIVMAGCFGVLVLKSLPFIIMTGGAYRLYGPQFSMISDNNDFGLALNMTVPLFFFLAQIESNLWLKRLFGFLFVATIAAIFCTYSRGALIGLAATFGLMLLRLKQRAVLVPIVILAAAIAFLFAPEAWKERMNPGQGLDGSARERLNAWTFSWNLALDYPVTGGGFSTFTPELFERYAPVVDDVRGPHSVYFGVLAEHGFVGLALYLALVISCFAKGQRLLKYARFYEDRNVAGYVNMFGFSLVGFLVSGVFLGRAYFDYYFSIVACMVILDRVARNAWELQSAEGAEAFSEAEEGLLLPGSRAIAQRG